MKFLETEFRAIDDLLDYVQAFPEAAPEAARIALNDVAGGEGLAVLRHSVEDEIAFPPGYLNDSRLGLTKRARNADLRAVITGRQRATSLARFARGQTPSTTRGKGVRVTVHPGKSKTLEGAFLVNLKRGTSDGGNVGLAVRLKPGEVLRNKRDVQKQRLGDNVYLLYGPSVDQVFLDVAIDDEPELLKMASAEFFRQFFRITNKKGRR